MKIIDVSVVMCTYNGASHLREQLDSILTQTYPIKEVIIQDDKSTDTTWYILQEYAKKYACIRVFQNEVQLGVNQNFISAFHKAQGDYIAISDQDDVWKHEKIEVYINELENEPYSLVYSNSFITDKYLNVKSVMDFGKRNIYDMVWMGTIPGHSIMFKREILLQIKNLNEIDFIYDWLLNITSVSVGKIKQVKVPLTYWRRHDLTVTNLNYIPPVTEYMPPISVILYVMKLMMGKKTIKNFKWQFENVYLILKNFKRLKRMPLLIDFLYFYKKENIIGMLISSIIYMILRNDLPFNERVKSIYTPIYRYYYYKTDGDGLRG